MTGRELEFVIFAIENTAARLALPAPQLYDALDAAGLVDDYLAANYDVLHTQGREYIVDDLVETMQAKGVVL